MIKFICPECRFEYVVEDCFVGRKINCAHCGTSSIVSGTENFSTKSEVFPRLQSSTLRNQETIVSLNELQTKDNDSFQAGISCSVREILLPFVVGEYLATKKLSQGGMSTTYLGYKKDDPMQKVVIKIPDIISAKNIRLFRSECKILSVLTHPNIVPILDYGDLHVNGQTYPYMVMKFIDGPSLRQQLDTKGKLPWDEAKKLLTDIAAALGYLFINNFCHRDIKPDNIIFDTKSQKWILVDFGIAKSLHGNIMLTMTMIGQDSGTWDYMSPEQLEGNAADIRSDIYALGTVIWEALIGTVPRRGTKLPTAYGLELPSDVDVLIEKMVEHNPKDRYQTPEEILQALHSGAQVVEDWKRTKKKARTALKIFSVSLIITTLLIVAWFIGNFVAIAKAKSIYETNKWSGTLSLQKLNIFVAKLPFYWGRHYLLSLKPELESKALLEEKQMLQEYNEIKDDICIHTGSDEELTRREILCSNFISKWGKIFNVKEVSETAQNQKLLNNILCYRNELKLVSDTIAKAQKGTEEKEEAKYKAALESCNQILKSLKTSECRNKLNAYIAELRREAAREILKKICSWQQSNSPEVWYNAYQKIDDARSIFGNEPALLSEQRKIDDKLWEFYHSESEKALKDHRFTNAREYINRYKDAGLKVHVIEVRKVLSEISQKEKYYDWEETVKIIKKHLESDAFPAALSDLDRFVQKYPETQPNVTIKKWKEDIAERFLNFILEKRKNLDSYQENFKIFLEKFPGDIKNIKILKRFLCWSIHNAVFEIVFRDDSTQETKRDLLAQIKYGDCEQYQIDYLRQLIASAMDLTVEKSSDNHYHFLYYYQRPPKDCVEMPTPPTVFYVTIKEIKVALSDSHYEELKGMNDCNPEIHIGLPSNRDPWKKIHCPKNDQTFTCSPLFSFWADTKGEYLEIKIADSDRFLRAKEYSATLDQEVFHKSGSRCWTLANETSLEISWETR